MENLGRTDLMVSPLCLGGNVFGWTADAETSFAVLDAYVASGGNFIDTADVYSDWVDGNSGGESETIIGDWMASRGNRDDIVIATKVGKLRSGWGLSPDNIATCVAASLRRLRTDHIDLYYAHRDDDEVALEDTITALDALVRAGKVRHLAASNYSADRLQQALDISTASGLAPYAALQNQYHLMDRTGYEGDVERVVADNQLGFLPFYGLARGFLTGKYRGGTVIDSPRAEIAGGFAGERGDRVLAVLESIAHTHDTTMASVALAWLRSRPTVTAPIASARSVEQLNDWIDMARLELSADEVTALDEAST